MQELLIQIVNYKLNVGEIIMKVLIIGSVASGKSTLARRLSQKTNIKNYEIDLIVHDDVNKIKRNNEKQQEIIKNINKNNDWIIEGTLRKNLYNLLDMADRIIYLDIPLKIRKKRIFIRYLKQKLKIENSSYKPNKELLEKMYKWTEEFETDREKYEERLLKYKEKLVILKNNKDIKNICR